MKNIWVILVFAFLMSGCQYFSRGDSNPETNPEMIHKDKTILSYLKDNHQVYDCINGNTSFPLLNDDLNDYSIFLLGESHAVQCNTEISFDLLTFLHQHAGVQTYLGEFSVSQGFLINEYLETGDLTKLYHLFEMSKGAYSYTQETFEFWNRLYDYNHSLEDGIAPIQVIGLDIANNRPLAFSYLYSLIKHKPDLPESMKLLSELSAYIEEPLNDEELAEFRKKRDQYARSLQQDVKSRNDDYAELLGNRFFQFEFVLDNIVQANEVHDYAYHQNDARRFYSRREELIMENFTRFERQTDVTEKTKYFGQWGIAHIFLEDQLESGIEKTLAQRLHESSVYNNQVLSIGVLYDYSYYRHYDGDSEKVSNYFDDYNLSNKKELRSHFPDQTILFKLDGIDSPFQNKPYFIPVPVEGTVTTDYFQYLLLIHQSPAATRFRE